MIGGIAGAQTRFIRICRCRLPLRFGAQSSLFIGPRRGCRVRAMIERQYRLLLFLREGCRAHSDIQKNDAGDDKFLHDGFLSEMSSNAK
jgi:hypothetical protein